MTEMPIIVNSSDLLESWKRIVLSYVRSGQPDLTNRQMAILLTVAGEKGPHTVRGLAAKLNVSKPVITRALNKLAQLGYLRRHRDDEDRRNVFVDTTEKGTEFLGSIAKFGRQPTKLHT